MGAWSNENAIKAFQHGFNVPAHKIQLGQEFELIFLKYEILLGNFNIQWCALIRDALIRDKSLFSEKLSGD